METKFDAIVIGSGIGGLSTAALLAKAYDKKVLVIEKHWTLGGLTHEFERKRKYSWDVGLHYLGDMKKGELPYDVFNYISDGALQWDKVNDPYDIFWYPDMKFGAVSGEEPYMNSIIEKFPNEEKAIRQYFKDIRKATVWGRDRFMSIALPKALAKVMKFLVRKREKFYLQTAQAYFDARIKDPKLKALLLSQWGDYGVAPEKAVFWIHASVAAHYMKGAYYPHGGAKRIAETIVPVIERKGGKCMINTECTEILVEDNKAIGVRIKYKKEGEWVEENIYAPKVISNVGAKNTYHRLLKNPIHPELAELKGEATSVTVYMGLKENPAQRFDVHGGNFWIFEGYDHNKIAANKDLVDGNIDMCYLSFPSLKDTSKTEHTAEIVAFTSYEAFQPWAGTDWMRRGEEYKALKERIAQRFIQYLDQKFPGFSDIVDYVEVATPLSMEKFTNRAGGAMYGLPCTEQRFTMDCLQSRTKIENLYLSGADVFMLGVCGAMFGGLAAASVAAGGFGLAKLMYKINTEKEKVSVVREKEYTLDKGRVPVPSPAM